LSDFSRLFLALLICVLAATAADEARAGKGKPKNSAQNGLRPVLYDAAGSPVRAWISQVAASRVTGILEVEENLYTNFGLELRNGETWIALPGDDYFLAVFGTPDCSGPPYALPGFGSGGARTSADPFTKIVSPVLVPSRDLVIATESEQLIHMQSYAVPSPSGSICYQYDIGAVSVFETRVLLTADLLTGPFFLRYE
jgi:hypothetical protein